MNLKWTGISTRILRGSTRGSWFDAPSQSCSNYFFPNSPLQTARCTDKTFERQKRSITISRKPSLHLQGLGKERKGRHAIPMAYLVLPGCRDQMHLAIPKGTQGVSGKPGEPLSSSMAEVLQSHQDLPLLVTRPGSNWHKGNFFPRQLEKSCKPHLLSPHLHRATSLFCNGAGPSCCHIKRDKKMKFKEI